MNVIRVMYKLDKVENSLNFCNLNFKKGECYYANVHLRSEENSDGFRSFYWVYFGDMDYFSSGMRLYLDRPLHHSGLQSLYYVFSDYFYTEQEIRRLKLERLGDEYL